MSAELAEDRGFVESDEEEPDEAAADDEEEPAATGEDPRDLGLVLDAAALKAAYAKIARLVHLAETRNERVLKSILIASTAGAATIACTRQDAGLGPCAQDQL